MNIEYELITQDKITEQIRATFAAALAQQGKVQGDLLQKADRCKIICFAKIDTEVVGVGALKIKTESDFSAEKAALPNLSKDFSWELGYVFTAPAHAGKGIAKTMCRMLVESHSEENLMASTEVCANPAMVSILENLNFHLCGRQWKSAIHGNNLGLYLRYSSREKQKIK